MAKKFLLVFGLFMATMVCSASITPVDFQTGYVNPNDAKTTHRPKSPMRPPVVYIEDYTLSFVADHPDYELTILDEDGNVVYMTMVESAQTEVILPSVLSGDYYVELVMGNWLFTGLIEL
jgi:hypothetical protein